MTFKEKLKNECSNIITSSDVNDGRIIPKFDENISAVIVLKVLTDYNIFGEHILNILGLVR
jgi:hypothetical protein